MAELIKGVDVNKVIKNLSGKVLENVDLSGVKLPDAKVEIGEDTKKLITNIGIGLVVAWLASRLF